MRIEAAQPRIGKDSSALSCGCLTDKLRPERSIPTLARTSVACVGNGFGDLVECFGGKKTFRYKNKRR